MPSTTVFDISLNSIYSSCYEDTIKLMLNVEPQNKLEAGIFCLPKCKKLLKWGNFNENLTIQRQTMKDNNITLPPPPYFDNWSFNVTHGPNKVKVTSQFKSFKKNEFKPIIDKELKKMENGDGVVGLDGNTPCPKHFKTWTSQAGLAALCKVEMDKLNNDPLIDVLKPLYIQCGRYMG